MSSSFLPKTFFQPTLLRETPQFIVEKFRMVLKTVVFCIDKGCTELKVLQKLIRVCQKNLKKVLLRAKTFLKTLRSMKDITKPYQILENPLSEPSICIEGSC